MRRVFFSCLLGVLCPLGIVSSIAAVSPWRTVVTSYPSEALARRIEGKGTVRVVTDETGFVKEAHMERSTGSKVLDDATLKAARTYWQGPHSTTALVPIEYKIPPPVAASAGKTKLAHPGWTIPSHPYPADAGDVYEQGRGVVRATTDAGGRVTEAVMVRSTGHARLDADALNNARQRWHGPPSASIELPVVYQMDTGVPLSKVASSKGWVTPKPYYPSGELVRRGAGSGVIRVSTDARGRVVRAVMERPIDSDSLDENTVNYALARWSGPPDSTCRVPITYRINH